MRCRHLIRATLALTRTPPPTGSGITPAALSLPSNQHHPRPAPGVFVLTEGCRGMALTGWFWGHGPLAVATKHFLSGGLHIVRQPRCSGSRAAGGLRCTHSGADWQIKKSRPAKGRDRRFYRYSCGIFFSCSSNDQSSGLRFELFHLAPLDNHLFL